MSYQEDAQAEMWDAIARQDAERAARELEPATLAEQLDAAPLVEAGDTPNGLWHNRGAKC